jgi:hypothetical protein
MQEDLEYRRDDFYAAETVRIQGTSALVTTDETEFEKLKKEIYSNVRGAYMAARNEDGYVRMYPAEATKRIIPKSQKRLPSIACSQLFIIS